MYVPINAAQEMKAIVIASSEFLGFFKSLTLFDRVSLVLTKNPNATGWKFLLQASPSFLNPPEPS